MIILRAFGVNDANSRSESTYPNARTDVLAISEEMGEMTYLDCREQAGSLNKITTEISAAEAVLAGVGYVRSSGILTDNL